MRALATFIRTVKILEHKSGSILYKLKKDGCLDMCT
jgi:hypothetical protein